MIISKAKLVKLLKENLGLNAPKIKIRILDFDDTIANTGEQVQLKTPSGYRSLDSSEYATYSPAEDEYYDDTAFKQFDSVDPDLATPVQGVFQILKNFLLASEGLRIILILTARKQIVKQSIIDFLSKEFEKEQDSLKKSNLLSALNDIHFRGVGSSDPQKKVEVIKEYIAILSQDYDIEEISFFDDSEKNVIAVRDYLKSTGIKYDIAKPTENPDGGHPLMPRYRE